MVGSVGKVTLIFALKLSTKYILNVLFDNGLFQNLTGECKKTVEVSAAQDHDQELYCKTCHSRLFGPKGYGFAGGAGTMLSMDTGKSDEITTRFAQE